MVVLLDSACARPPYQRPGFKLPVPRKYTPPGQARHLYALTDGGTHIETMEWQYPLSAEAKWQVAIWVSEDRPELNGPIKIRKSTDAERTAYIAENPVKPDFAKAPALAQQRPRTPDRVPTAGETSKPKDDYHFTSDRFHDLS